MKIKYSYPAKCRLAESISDRDWERMMPCLNAIEREVKPGCYIQREGDSANRVGIVVSGKVVISRERIDGTRVVLEHVGPNESFGASYVYSGARALNVSIMATEPSRVILIDARCVPAICEKACRCHVQMIRNMLAVICIRNFQIKLRLRILSQRSIRAKLMLYLNVMAKREGKREFDIPLDRQQLADYLCVDRCALSSEISKLRREKVLESEKSRFRLLKGKSV